ncbi:MAG: hypothetical protein QM655_06485 [Nocardioidaceae bacterium]
MAFVCRCRSPIGGPAYWDLRSDAERAALRDADVRFDATLTFSDLGSMLLLMQPRRRFALVPADADMIRGLDPAEFAAHPLSDEVPPLVRQRGDGWIEDFSALCRMVLLAG